MLTGLQHVKAESSTHLSSLTDVAVVMYKARYVAKAVSTTSRTLTDSIQDISVKLGHGELIDLISYESNLTSRRTFHEEVLFSLPTSRRSRRCRTMSAS